MPIGAEVHFEVGLGNFKEILRLLCEKNDEQKIFEGYITAVGSNDSGKSLDWWDLFCNSKCYKYICDGLEEAWKDSFKDFVDVFSANKNSCSYASDSYVATISKYGKTVTRQINSFDFNLYGDDDEIGDRWPDDFAFGIGLSSRYFPVYLDWMSEHGGGYGLDDIFKPEDPEIKNGIIIAKKHISRRVPEFRDNLELVHRLIFY